MQRRTFAITAALVIGLALGVIFSPALRGSDASAQEQPPATTQPQASASNLRTYFFDQLAAALNIQRPALDTAIKDAAAGTVDEAVRQGRLTQAQADQLKARIQSGDVDAFGGLPFGGPGGRGGKRGGAELAGVRQAMLDAAAQTLNLTTGELTTQLRAGQTLAQVAQANGTTEQAVIDAALAAAKTQLDQAVANGTLTQARADAIYTRLQQQGSQLFGGRHGGRGWRGAPDAPQQPTATPSGI
jgi:hypothetical protein